MDDGLVPADGFGAVNRSAGVTPPRMGFLAAAHYLWRVLAPRNPRDQRRCGCLFLAATEGRSYARAFARFGADPAGQRLLAARPPFRDIMHDRAALAAAPAGSLAREYDAFLSRHGLEDLGLDADLGAISAGFGEGEAMRWFRRRDAFMHDVRHLLTGYGPDRAGEMCLLAFRYAQMRHRGLLILMVLAAVGELVRLRPVVAAIAEAYRRGRTTPLLDFVAWEEAPERSLESYRRSLGLQPPRHYRWPQPVAA